MAISLAGSLSQLEIDIKSALEEAFKDTYLGENTPIGDAMAESFASTTASTWAKAIYTMALGAKITGTNSNTSAILGQNYIASAAGPIPGPPVPGVGVVSLTGLEINLI